MNKRTTVKSASAVVALVVFYAIIHQNLTRPGHVSFQILAAPTMTNIEIDGRPAHRLRFFGKEIESNFGEHVYGTFHTKPGTVTVGWEDQGEQFEAEVWFAPHRPYSFSSLLYLEDKSRRDSPKAKDGRYINVWSRSEKLEVQSVKKDGAEVANVVPGEEPSSAEQSQPSE